MILGASSRSATVSKNRHDIQTFHQTGIPRQQEYFQQIARRFRHADDVGQNGIFIDLFLGPADQPEEGNCLIRFRAKLKLGREWARVENLAVASSTLSGSASAG